MADNITIAPNQAELERQFAFVNSMIERYRSSAISMVNTAALQMNWEIGQYISMQLKSARWGTKIVCDLADYLKRTNPKQRGFGKRHLYNMVKFYDTYSAKPFLNTLSNLHLPEFVQSRIAQLETPSKSVTNEIVQLGIAQLEEDLQPLPKLLSIIPFTSHIEIMNRCRSDEERIFYMLYARYQGLKTEELRRCIVNQTFSSLMDKEKMPHHYIKYIRDGLYEFRVTYGNNEFRLFFIFDGEQIVVLFNCFRKKSQKTPKKEINKALKLKGEYYEQKG